MKSINKNQHENKPGFPLVGMIKFSIVIAVAGVLMCLVFLLADKL